MVHPRPPMKRSLAPSLIRRAGSKSQDLRVWRKRVGCWRSCAAHQIRDSDLWMFKPRHTLLWYIQLLLLVEMFSPWHTSQWYQKLFILVGWQCPETNVNYCERFFLTEEKYEKRILFTSHFGMACTCRVLYSYSERQRSILVNIIYKYRSKEQKKIKSLRQGKYSFWCQRYIQYLSTKELVLYSNL